MSMQTEDFEELPHAIADFFEWFVHQILFYREVYPQESFEMVKFCNYPSYKSCCPSVIDYIREWHSILSATCEPGKMTVVIQIEDPPMRNKLVEGYYLKIFIRGSQGRKLLPNWKSFEDSLPDIISRLISVTEVENARHPLITETRRFRIFYRMQKLLHGKAPYDSITPIQPVKLLEQPSIHISLLPNSVLTVEGTPVSLHCAAHGVPTPVIYWKFNGEYLPQGKLEKDRPEMELLMNIGQRTLQSSNTAGQLEIDCITVDQAGIYECVANNGITEVSAKAVIAVKETMKRQLSNTPHNSMCSSDGEVLPKIYMWTDFRIEMEEASVQLFCRAKGNPMPEIQWFTGDGKRIINDNRFQILKSGDLLIKRGNWKLAGLYICKAINELGEDDIQTFYYPTANTEEKSGNEKK